MSRSTLGRGAVAALCAALLPVVPAATASAAPRPPGPPSDAKLAQAPARHDLTREQFYFVMPDRFADGDPSNNRGGLTGSRLETGYDPTDKGFYQGGDLKGLTERLDYIKGLGTTAIWLAPIFENRPVQGTGKDASAKLPRLLDHRLHPGRPALRDQRRPDEADRQGPRQGHEGLLRRHHQPHRRHRRLRREGVRLPAEGRLPVPGQGRPPVRRQQGPGEGRRGLVPVHAGQHHERQGPGLAQRPHDVPQPGRLDLHAASPPSTATSPGWTICGPNGPRS